MIFYIESDHKLIEATAVYIKTVIGEERYNVVAILFTKEEEVLFSYDEWRMAALKMDELASFNYKKAVIIR